MSSFKSKPKILEANVLYLIIALLLLSIGAYAQQREIYSGLLITEYILILIPILLYLKIKGFSIKKVLRLNKLGFKEVLLVPLITLLAYPVGAFLNALMMIIISFFGEIQAPPLPTPSTGGTYLMGLFIIAITPGICEEVMFRGFIMKAYDNKGYKKAIFISAILFGVFHFNIQNLFGPIFLGILFGFIVYRTDSLLAGIIGHATNNAFAWTISYFVTKYGSNIEQTEEVGLEIPQTMALVIGAVTLLGIALLTSILALYLYKKLPDRRVLKQEIENPLDEKDIENEDSKGVLKYIPIIIAVIGFIVLNTLVYI